MEQRHQCCESNLGRSSILSIFYFWSESHTQLYSVRRCYCRCGHPRFTVCKWAHTFCSTHTKTHEDHHRLTLSGSSDNSGPPSMCVDTWGARGRVSGICLQTLLAAYPVTNCISPVRLDANEILCMKQH